MHAYNSDMQSGFSLIELMIVLMIIAVLTAMALPSYHRFLLKNSMAEAETKMQSLAVQLDRHRASALTYNGFVPSYVDNTGTTVFAYNAGNNVVYSDMSGKHKYAIAISQDPRGKRKGSPNHPTIDWRMVATPTDNAPSNAPTYYFYSTGERCYFAPKAKVGNGSCVKNGAYVKGASPW